MCTPPPNKPQKKRKKEGDARAPGVLRQEAVARVDRLRAAARGGGEEVGDVEVRLAGGRLADADGLVGELVLFRVFCFCFCF